MLGPAGWDDPVVELVAVGEPGDPVVEGVEVVCLFGLVEDGQAGGDAGGSGSSRLRDVLVARRTGSSLSLGARVMRCSGTGRG